MKMYKFVVSANGYNGNFIEITAELLKRMSASATLGLWDFTLKLPTFTSIPEIPYMLLTGNIELNNVSVSTLLWEKDMTVTFRLSPKTQKG